MSGRDKRRQILEFIKNYIKENGYSPSFRDIASGCSLSSTSVVAYYLDSLEEQGLVKREEFRSRSFRTVR